MTNKKITWLLAIISVMFLSIIIYLTAFDLVNHDKYAVDISTERENYVVRGKIYDRNKTLLANSTGIGAGQKREYPYKNLYAHIIGYKSDTSGSNDIEKFYNSDLMGKSSAPLVGGFVTFFKDIKSMTGDTSNSYGDNITLTIDHRLQQTAHDALGNYKGAVVALNPQTGEVLAMVSKPDFDPSNDKGKSEIDNATKLNNNALLRRATLENYSPGSTFKVVVAASMIENGCDDFVFDDNSELTVKIKNYGEGEGKFLGETDLLLGFKSSSNIYFSEAAINLGSEKLIKTAKNFLFEENLMLDRLGVAKSTLPQKIESNGDITNTALGQGDVKTSPLHLAMIASAVANDGIMMKPYIVSQIPGPAGSRAKPQKLKKCITSATASKLKDLMKECVLSGTGAMAQVYGKDVCGKTGTSEIDTKAGTANALFIGFAPYDNPQIAICVVAENLPNNNTGGTVAAPIAKKVIQKYFELN